MKICRQHSETELHEIYGNDCRSIVAIPGESADVIYALYLQVGMIWLRLFINAELLFVDECSGPDPEDDLVEGEHYQDFNSELKNMSNKIEIAEMKNGIFTLGFSDGTKICLSEAENGTRLKFLTK